MVGGYLLEHGHLLGLIWYVKNDDTVFLHLYDSVFSFQNYPESLDPSYKMDLDLWDCLRKVKLVLEQNCIGLI